MPTEKQLAGKIITDKERLAQVKTWLDEEITLHSKGLARNRERIAELVTLLYNAFEIPERERSFFRNDIGYLGKVCRLLNASRNAICIAEKKLEPGITVLITRKLHPATIKGYTVEYELRLELIDAALFKQRSRTMSPKDVIPIGGKPA
jgi:hypothetical protein